MKKLLAILLATLMLVSMSACSSSNNTADDESKSDESSETADETTDDSTDEETTVSYDAYPGETEFVEFTLGFDSDLITMVVPTDYIFTEALVVNENGELEEVKAAENITTVADALADGTLSTDNVYAAMDVNSESGEIILSATVFGFTSEGGSSYSTFDDIVELGGDDVTVFDGTAMRSCIQTGFDNCDFILFVEANENTGISVSYSSHSDVDASEMGLNVYSLFTAK